MAYGVVNTDNLSGTFDGSKLVSFRYMPGDVATPIENGCVVALDSKLSTYPRDLWKAVDPTAKQALGKLVLVAGVEMDYKSSMTNLEDIRNEAGADTRGYVLTSGDDYSVTAAAITGTLNATNKYLTVAAANKLVAGNVADGAVAEYVSSWTDGATDYLEIRVF